MTRRGFTLLEILVAVSLFTVAIFIIIVTLFSISNAQKKALAIQNVQDNMRFAFEAMTKEIRTGKIFHCGTGTPLTNPANCQFPNPGASLSFLNTAGETVTYQRQGNQLVKSTTGTLPCDEPLGPVQDCLKITSPQLVNITRLNFYVDGSVGGDNKQAIATIVMEGEVIGPPGVGTTNINLQTTVSKRGLIDQP